MHKIIFRLGFHEDGPQAETRRNVLEAIRHGNLTQYKSAWSQYQELAEAQIESLPDIANAHGLAQIGLILAKAAIWLEVHDLVRYWEELADAEMYAERLSATLTLVVSSDSQGLLLNAERDSFHAELMQSGRDYDSANDVWIDRELDVILTEVVLYAAQRLRLGAEGSSDHAEFLQSGRDYYSAIDVYIEREQDEYLTDWERGMVNLRLAECYQGLLREDPENPEEVQVLLEASVQSALEYLKDSPYHILALRILDKLEAH